MSASDRKAKLAEALQRAERAERQEREMRSRLSAAEAAREAAERERDAARAEFAREPRAVADLRRRAEAAESTVEALREALEDFATQDGCACGHPACKRCERTAAARRALASPRTTPPEAAPGEDVECSCVGPNPTCWNCNGTGKVTP